MTTKRGMLLEALDAWHAEGTLDEPTWRFLRSRYEAAPSTPDLDAPLAPAGAPSPEPTRPAGPAAAHGGDADRGFAADAMQFVGGLLVGAALVALVAFLELDGDVRPWALLAGGALLLAPAAIGALRAAPRGLVEAGLAGGLVPLLVAAGDAMSEGRLAIALLVALAGLGATALRRAEGASLVVAAAAYSFGTASATVGRAGFLDGGDMLSRWIWIASLVGYGAFLLPWRERRWANVTLGLLVGPIALAYAMILDDISGLTSVGAELAMGVLLAALLGVGLALKVRGLVAASAAGLTIDAVVFAFDVGGPGTAVVVLLALGALLVWQAEVIRAYFRRR